MNVASELRHNNETPRRPERLKVPTSQRQEESQWERLYGAFFLVILLYIIGPNVRIFGALIQDIFFLGFLLVLMLSPVGDTRSLRLSHILFLSLPGLLATLAFIGQVESGESLSWDDLSGALKQLSLVALCVATVVVIRRFRGGDPRSAMSDLRRVLMLGVICVSIFGILQYLNWFDSDTIVKYMYAKDVAAGLTNFGYASMISRITSVFPSPLGFGSFLVLSLTFLLITAKGTDTRMLLGATAVGSLALILTNARMAIVCLGLTLVVLIVRRGNTRALGIGVVLICLPLSVFVFDSLDRTNADRYKEVLEYVNSGFNEVYAPESLYTRIDFQQHIIGTVFSSDRWLFGYPTQTYDLLVTYSPDSQYVAYLVKYGVAGMLMSLWQVVLLLYFIVRYIRLRRTDAEPVLFALTLISFYLLLLALSQEVSIHPRIREVLFAVMAASTLYERDADSPSSTTGWAP